MNTTKSRREPLYITFLACLSLAIVGCSDDGGEAGDDQTDETETGQETGEEGLEIVGEYIDDFMSEHSISEDQWVIGDSTFEIDEYDNAQMWIIAQNAADNMFNPGLWSRFEWTWSGEQLYYCQSIFDAASLDDAKAGEGADPNDLQAGCGMSPWSMLNPQ